MGKKWNRTTDQTVYLHGQFSAYHDARQNGNMEAFRARLYEGWTRLWPERVVVFPSWKEGDTPLTKDQMTTLGCAIARRKKVDFLSPICY
jgi:hypothetical protein